MNKYGKFCMGILRFFLAYVVLVSHCPDGLLTRIFHPALAVQCFFTISGFYMQLLISEKYNKQSPFYFCKDFYLSRIFRIFPVYLLILTITFVFANQGHALHYLDTGRFELFFYDAFTNIFIIGQSFLRIFPYNDMLGQFVLSISDTEIPSASFGLMVQSWSLDLELLFYILAPFILTIKRLWIILVIIIASISLRFILALNDINYVLNLAWINEFFPLELATFLLGSIAYRIYYFLKYELNNIINNKYLIAIQSLFNKSTSKVSSMKMPIPYLYLFVSFIVIYYYTKKWAWVYDFGGDWDQGLFGVPHIYWFTLLLNAVFVPILFELSKNLKLDSFIGKLSYPLYISHFTIILLLHKIGIEDQVFGIYVLACSILVSIALVLFIENPITRYRHRKFYKIK